MTSKPAFFSDYYASRKSQGANDHLDKVNALIKANGRSFATYKCLKEVVHLTKVEGFPEPLAFHSLIDITQPRGNDDPFSIASWHCVLSGFKETIRVYKVNQKDLFQRVQVNNDRGGSHVSYLPSSSC